MFCMETEPFHDGPHVVDAFGVKQVIMVGHLPHTANGIQMLKHRALEGHMPDTGSIQRPEHHTHLRVHGDVFHDGALEGFGKAVIPHPRRFQCRGDRSRQHMTAGQLIQRVQVHARDALRVGHGFIDGAGSKIWAASWPIWNVRIRRG